MRKITIRNIALLVIALVLVSGSLVLNGAKAQSQSQAEPESNTLRTISVAGIGRASAQPDTAVIMVGVRTEAATAQEALSQNNQDSQGLLKALADAGIAQADLQTQSIQLQPRFEQAGDQSSTGQSTAGQLAEAPGIVGFTATNILQVRVREIDNLGEILDEAVSAGGNTIEAVFFEISDATSLEDEARADAVADARRKAEQMAGLVNASLGEVVSISEGTQSPIPFGQAREAVAQAGSVPVEPGTQTIIVQVQVTWELEVGTGAGLPNTGATTTPGASAATLNGLVSALRTAGATVKVAGEIEQPFFAVTGQVLTVNGAEVQVFEFRSETERKAASDTISSTGDAIGNSIPTWIGHPNFWANGRIIVLYIGEDNQMISLLSNALGDAITGGGGANQPAAALKAQSQLATRLGLQVSRVEIVSVTAQEWRDSCLGLGQANESCLQVITPGYLVILKANNRTYEAHTDQQGSTIRWK